MRATLVTLACSLLPGLTFAQSLQNIILRNSFSPSGAGARGTGMGGAFIAVADDGTAASFNPAGLAQLRRCELAFVGFDDRLLSEQGQGEGEAEIEVTRQRHDVPEFVGLAVPFELGSRRVTVQLSYQRSVDLFGKGVASVLLPLNPAAVPAEGPFDAVTLELDSSQSGALHTVSLASGIQLTERLSLGASVNLWIGSWRAQGIEEGWLDIRRPDLGPPGHHHAFREEFENQQGLHGLNVTTGVLLRYPKLSIGGVLRLPFAGSYRLDEELVETDYLAAETPRTAEWQTQSDTRLLWPLSAGVGVALRPLRWLTLAADYSYVEWSRTTIENVPNGALLTEAVTDENGVRQYPLLVDRNFFDLYPAGLSVTQDSAQVRVGAEALWGFRRFVIPIRIGAYQDRSPVPDLGRMEGRRIEGVTFGTGINFDRLVFDVTFERRTSEGAVGLLLSEGSFSAETPSASFPTERVTQERVVGSLIVRLGGTGDRFLRRLLRGIFGSKEG